MINASIETNIDFGNNVFTIIPGNNSIYFYRSFGKYKAKDSTGLETIFQPELNSNTDVTVKSITVTDSIITPNLHNNVNALNNNQQIVSGTYSPTLNITNNIAIGTLISSSGFRYMRVGNLVQISGKVNFTPSANNSFTSFTISLPIAPSTNFNNVAQCIGIGGSNLPSSTGQSRQGMYVEAVVATNLVVASLFSSSTANMNYNIMFSYEI